METHRRIQELMREHFTSQGHQVTLERYNPENEVPLAGRSVIGFGMYNGGGRMDASAVIEGGVITWESFGKDWPDDIRETYIARHLFRFLDSYSWTARTGGELVNYIQDGWDEPGSNSTIYASYGNPRAVDGA